jgi:predicted NBD/HSP70 family sugar kinase
MRKYVLGMEIGGTMIRVCIGDDHRKLYYIISEPIDFSHGDQGIASQAISMIRRCTKRADTKISELLGLGIGAAGQPDEANGMIHNAANCPWKSMKLPGILSKELKIPIWVRNDVAVAVYAARKIGYGKQFSNLVPRWDAAMTIGTGTNIAIMYEDTLLLNSRNESLEWGHTKLNTDSRYLPSCGCGGRGCIESYISGAGIRTRTIDMLLERSRPAGKKLLHEPILRETMLRVYRKKGKDVRPQTLINMVHAEDVFAAYRKTNGRDKLSAKIVDDTSTYLAYAFASIIGSYPVIPYVEIFGSVALNNPKLVEAAIQKLEKDTIRFCNRDLSKQKTRFLVTGMQDIGLHGAVELAWFELNR